MPGPIIIFDKSALECLNVDEALWLDNFFLTNITPLFFVETLADLQKPLVCQHLENISRAASPRECYPARLR